MGEVKPELVSEPRESEVQQTTELGKGGEEKSFQGHSGFSSDIPTVTDTEDATHTSAVKDSEEVTPGAKATKSKAETKEPHEEDTVMEVSETEQLVSPTVVSETVKDNGEEVMPQHSAQAGKVPH
ncbi:hypothetical protein Bbelb_446630 [Branchiostoma belcheri]|nr:hypothetical protein Bbelb_446630 [Branchiostoma belcheri]